MSLLIKNTDFIEQMPCCKKIRKKYDENNNRLNNLLEKDLYFWNLLRVIGYLIEEIIEK